MEEMKLPKPRLQGNALPFRASNGLNDITQGAASLCPGL